MKKKKLIITSAVVFFVACAGGVGLYVNHLNTNNSQPKTEQVHKKKSSSEVGSSSSIDSSKNKESSKSSSKDSKSSNSNKASSKKDSSSTAKTSANKTKANESRSGVTKDNENMSKQGVVSSAQDLLQAVNVSPDGKMSDNDRLKLLSKSDNAYNKVLTSQARSKIRLVDYMQTDKRGGTLTAEALIEVTSSIKKAGNKNLTATKLDSYDTVVYLDKTNKIAIVPVDLFTKAATNLSLEFVYTNGQWILQPYSLISEINIRQSDKQALNNTPEGNAQSSNDSSSK